MIPGHRAMMHRTWQLSDLEFFVLWDDLDEGLLPDPLEFVARTDDYDEWERQRGLARARLRPVLDDALEDLREALVHPDIRIVVFGRDHRTPDDPEHCLRMLGVRRESRGYLIRQIMGETLWHSAGFVVTECEATRLGTLIAEQLPAAEPGRRGEVPLRAPESTHVDYDYGRSAVYQSRSRRTHDSADFLGAPLSLVGTIQVLQNASLFGPRGLSSRALAWRDHIGDGRYAITVGNEPTAVPADTRRLSTMIDTAVADIVRVIKEERQ